MEPQLSEPLKPGVVHKFEKSISLKLCLITLKKNIWYFNYPNRTVTTLIRVIISVVWLTKNLDMWGPDN